MYGEGLRREESSFIESEGERVRMYLESMGKSKTEVAGAGEISQTGEARDVKLQLIEGTGNKVLMNSRERFQQMCTGQKPRTHRSTTLLNKYRNADSSRKKQVGNGREK